VRHARRTDRRPLAAFLLLIAAGLGLLLWSPWHGGTVAPQAAGTPEQAGTPVAAAPTPAAPPPSSAAAGSTVRVSPAAATGPIVPTRLLIPAIGVDAPVESRGTVRTTNPFTGQVVDGYGVPESMSTTSWWSDGPRPGSGRMAVVLGHEQVGGGYGVFNRLTQLHAGDDVTLRDRSGAALHLRVLQAPVTGLDKSTPALADALNRHPAGADVALVTCGGKFDPKARQSEDNTVVFASVVPAG
jgi:sortase (surface protein transpeptidase)